MKIVVLISATFFGFGLACQDLSYAPKAATPAKIVYVEYEEPVATVHLDTVVVVAKAPAHLAAR